jgi:alpha-tubulin suppressor-like RCC1 family protein
MKRLMAVLAPLTGLLVLAGNAGALTTPTAEYWGIADGGVFTVPTPTPVPVQGHIMQVATSNGAWYALKHNGAVWAWGAGQHGQLGDGQLTNTLRPVKVAFPTGVKIAFLADTSPYDTELAVDTTGQAWGWGYNSNGQLCNGATDEEVSPVKLPFTGVTALTGAGDHALYVSNGSLFACGSNNYGDLGIGTTTPSYVPVTVSLPGVTSVTSSWRTSGALVGGTYYSWGYNALGAVGDGSTTDALTPQRISLPESATMVRLGGGGPLDGQTLALLSNGTMWAWGSDTYGQLGDGGSGSVTSPERVSTPAPYVAVESDGEASYGLTASGHLWGWGSNRHDQLGNGATTTQLTPVILVMGVTEVSATAAAVIALR